MPRQKSPQPAYRLHISGQARVELDGRTYYLGEYGSKESWARYHALLAEYNANGQRMPVERPQQQADAPITVRCVTGEFREQIKVRYAKNRTRANHFTHLCKLLDEAFGDVPADQFGPRKLAELREQLIEKGNCRRFVNTQVRDVIAVFRYGVSRELVKPETLVGLQSLDALRVGQTTAKESRPVLPVKLEHVRQTAPHLSPVLRAMLRIQLATGMRPSEVANMRPVDICRDNEIWVYRPATHKTTHRGKQRAVPLVGDARDAVAPFLDRGAEEYCFSPAESAQWYRQQRTAQRVTPLSCGNRPGSKPTKTNPQRVPGRKYTKDSYRRAIQRAADKAGVPPWFPYQLRHLAATQIREVLGIEQAQALLGHSHRQMTEHYAQQSLTKAIEAAQVAPQL